MKKKWKTWKLDIFETFGKFEKLKIETNGKGQKTLTQVETLTSFVF